MRRVALPPAVLQRQQRLLQLGVQCRCRALHLPTRVSGGQCETRSFVVIAHSLHAYNTANHELICLANPQLMAFHRTAALALAVLVCAAAPTSYAPIYDEGAGADGDVAGAFFSGSYAYIYGTFTASVAGGALLRIARRDTAVAGSTWQKVGNGIAPASNLRAVAACLGSASATDVFAGGDTLVTGGWLNAGVLAVSAGGSSAFSLLPAGSPQGMAPVVTALACHRGQLVIGGSFASCGGLAETSNICTYDGASFGRLVSQGAAWPVTGMRASAGGTLYAMFASALLMHTGSVPGSWAGGVSVAGTAFAPADDDSALYICQADGNLRVVFNPVTGGSGSTISPSFTGVSGIAVAACHQHPPSHVVACIPCLLCIASRPRSARLSRPWWRLATGAHCTSAAPLPVPPPVRWAAPTTLPPTTARQLRGAPPWPASASRVSPSRHWQPMAVTCCWA